MTGIDIEVDVAAGVAELGGMLSNSDNVRLCVKEYAEYATATSRVMILVGSKVLSTSGGFEIDGRDCLATLNTNTDEIRRLAKFSCGPAQVGITVVVDDPEGNVNPCTGRGIILLNWSEDVPGGGGGKPVEHGSVPITSIDDLPARFRDTDVRNKINEIARVISGRAVVLAAILAPFASFSAGIDVMKATKGELYNDEQVVTDVSFSADGLVTDLGPMTNYVDAAEERAKEYAKSKADAASEGATNYVDYAKASLSADISAARTGAVSDAKAYTDSATNGIVIPTYDLSPYALKTWVEGRGYLLPSALSPYATMSWVDGKGYLTTTDLSGYATTAWVGSQGYLKTADMEGYARKQWVLDRGYAQQSWVESKNYASGADVESLSWRIEDVNDRISQMARMAVDTNGVTRLWAYDGSAMLDATGVVWDVSWSVVTNWTSLSNGIEYVAVDEHTWESVGVVTNMDGDVGVGVLQHASVGMMPPPYNINFFVKTVPGKVDTSDAPVDGMSFSVGGHEMRYDSFTGTVTRIPSFTYRNRFAYITEGAKPMLGQTFDFSDNRVLYTALSNIVIQLGGTVVNFPEFQ